jgi:isohexenylglutaconyl-CoA hydratase
MADLALLDEHDGVVRLSLNRPDSRNALSLELIDSLRAAVRELSAMDDVNVCVLTGVGKSFCAGMDLKAVLDDPKAPGMLLGALAELTIEIRALPMVTVASVQGAAIGGGCGLMCVCDLAITHVDAKIGYPEVDLGVCPAVVAPWLVQRIGAGAARRMLLVGGLMSGADAHSRGLVTGLVEDRAELDDAVVEVANRLRGAAPDALKATKAWLNETEAELLIAQVRKGAILSAETLADPEALETLRRRFAARK